MLVTIDDSVAKIDLKPYYKYIDWAWDKKYFDMPIGKNHTRLLAYISQHLPACKISDLGTSVGMSAIPLASNPSVLVTTYDISDSIPKDVVSYRNMTNTRYVLGPAQNYVSDMIDSLVIFLDIGLHESILEQEVYDKLKELNYKGLLICDDICYNDPMINFWSRINQKKLNLTSIGHWSGTGVVVFDPNTIDIKVIGKVSKDILIHKAFETI